uniref:Jacalin-type lectin domain-containing protein n=1 Tax=Phytophthora ramorum TaxID=164328 RepID=H3H0A8_PHYRM
MAKWIKLLALAAAVVVSPRAADAATSVVIGRTYTPATLTPTVASSSDDIDSDDDTSYSSSADSDSDDYSDSDDDASSSSGSSALVPVPDTFKIGSMANTTDTIVSTYRNWVGPSIGKPSDPAFDKACWRKAHIMDTCPYGYDYSAKMCWAECPMAYPVECGFECLRQSDDCGSEVYAKFVSVANAFFSVQILGVFGQFAKLSKTVRVGIKCARAMFGTIRAIVNYVRALKVSDPQTSMDKVMLALYQTSYITIDLPVSIVMCMGRSYPWEVLDPASVLMGTVQVMLGEILARQDGIIKSWGKFKAFLTHSNFTYAVNDLNETEISSLKTGMESNSSCGYELQRLTDRTWRTVAEMKEEDPDVSTEQLRVAMYKSDLMLHDIPTVTNNCMDQMITESDEATAYKTRDTLRKTYGVIVDDLISKGRSDNGTSLTAKQYTRVVADKVLMTIATLFYVDLTRISGALSEYIQTICGPTQLIGEVDDGTDPNTLGMKAVGDAFENSTMAWKRQGDGVVELTFVSTDTKDVTVNILSGGDKFDETDVPAGKTVTWTSTVKELGGKTLYLDRWRPGFLGLPGTGGGSLKLWVPRATEGGHLDVNAKLNVS